MGAAGLQKEHPQRGVQHLCVNLCKSPLSSLEHFWGYNTDFHGGSQNASLCTHVVCMYVCVHADAPALNRSLMLLIFGCRAGDMLLHRELRLIFGCMPWPGRHRCNVCAGGEAQSWRAKNKMEQNTAEL